ncbi:PDDEXK nuclease domain-containing protein [Janibacter sp. GXQ6167]|uniref:PDDEXK nuclease domain-containing protein n=1 Tax=Janibacter sp. GXQ6167 TaxID=3240791 RepID=UPI0035263318
MPGKRDQAQSRGAAARRSGPDLTPFRAIAESVSAGGGELVNQVSALIEQAQAFAATQVDATLTLRNWYIGRMIDVAVLREGRAGHDQKLVASLAQQLTSRYGRGYDRTNLYRMVRFSQQFTEPELVASLAQQVSWTHFRELLPLATDDARAFYGREIIERHFSVRELRYAISRKAFERREIADSQIPEGSAVPLDAFRDPMLLDMLGLADTYLERDLESALVHDMEAFLLEVGRGWAFVERQKRMTFDGDDYHLDLLFYSRPLRRLIAVELKVGKFKPSYQGQMNFYLKWLDRHERQADENPPSASSCVPRRAAIRSSCSSSTRTGSSSRSIGRRCRPRQSSKLVSRRSTGRHRSGSPEGSSPQRRKKTSMSRDWPARNTASAAAVVGSRRQRWR